MQLPTFFLTITFFTIGHANAGKIGPPLALFLVCDFMPTLMAASIRRQNGGFRDFVTGAGSAVFGNAGSKCSVGLDEGECDQFGRCVQFIPPNEQSILNQGREVDECIKGGQTGTLKV
ncbi:hypothetical protein FOBRF1_014623 [Fusarium oxysporum]